MKYKVGDIVNYNGVWCQVCEVLINADNNVVYSIVFEKLNGDRIYYHNIKNSELYVRYKPKTNRQWLESLSDEEFIDWLMNDYENLKYSFRSTRSGMIEWLQEEHID